MPKIRVKQGDSVSSIATAHGFSWKTVWDHAENAELKELREDPNVLYEGDELFVPERTLKQESAATEAMHRYRRLDIPDKLRLQILYEGEVQASASYVLDVDGQAFEGTTDGDGWIEQPISPEAHRARLTVGDGDDALVFQLELGHLEPIDEPGGAEARLRNLGYDPDQISGDSDDAFREALLAFQKAQELEETGELDEDTAGLLRDEHAS